MNQAGDIQRGSRFELGAIGVFVIIVAFVIAIILVGTYPKWPPHPVYRWYLMMGLIVIFMVLIGVSINSRLDGILIDWRNKISLARFQIAIWTVLVLATFLTIGFYRTTVQLDAITFENYRNQIGYVDELIKVEIGEICDVKTNNQGEVISIANCRQGNALDIYFPEDLLILMGISMASFAGASIIKGRKKTSSVSLTISPDDIMVKKAELSRAKLIRNVANEDLDQLAQAENEAKQKYDEAKESGDTQAEADTLSLLETATNKKEEAVIIFNAAKNKVDDIHAELITLMEEQEDYEGLIHKNSSPSEARWSDLFVKEEKNHQTVDFGKVQMFIFTIAIVFAYTVLIYQLLTNFEILNNPLGVALPMLSSSMIFLLGISQAGYLIVKAAPQTRST